MFIWFWILQTKWFVIRLIGGSGSSSSNPPMQPWNWWFTWWMKNQKSLDDVTECVYIWSKHSRSKWPYLWLIQNTFLHSGPAAIDPTPVLETVPSYDNVAFDIWYRLKGEDPGGVWGDMTWFYYWRQFKVHAVTFIEIPSKCAMPKCTSS